jgi:drug/metabolite transporter (DMT)-like permease
MNRKSSLLLGIGLTLIANLFFALSSACVQALPETFPAIEIVFFQNIICLLVTIPYCIKKKTLNFKMANLHFHLIRDFSGVLSFLTLFWAIQKIGLVSAMTLSYMTPFYVPFVCKFWSKEPIEKDVWWMVVIGFIGVMIILKPTNLLSLGSGIAVLSAILSAFAVVALKNLNQRGESLSRTLLYFFTIGSIFSLCLCLPNWQTPSIYQLFLLLSLGAFSICAQIFLTIAYRYGTASFLSPLSYSAIIFTAFMGWLIFRQPQHWSVWLGALVIIAGGTLSSILRLHPKNVEEVFEQENHVKKGWAFWRKFPRE